MSYLTNYKWSKIIGVTPNTIQVWIEKSLKGELDLDIGEDDSRVKIADTVDNKKKMQALKLKANKFNRQKGSTVRIQADKKIYDVYNSDQIELLIKGLRCSEIPMKLIYVGEIGSKTWNRFYEIAGVSSSYSANNNVYNYFCRAGGEFIKSRFAGIEQTGINVIDIGAGNGDPIVPYLKFFKENGNLLNSYIGVDISPQLLETVQENLDQSDLSSVRVEKLEADMDLVLPATTLYRLSRKGESYVPSLYCVFGGQISNNEMWEQDHIIQNIRYCMYPQDRLLVINALHNEQREEEIEPTSVDNFPSFQHKEFYDFINWIPNTLGISEDCYTPVFQYEPKTKRRSFGLKLNINIELEFNQPQTVVKLHQGQVIVSWKHRRETRESILQMAERTQMKIEKFMSSPDETMCAYLLAT